MTYQVKAFSHQARQPEFNNQKQQGRRREELLQIAH